MNASRLNVLFIENDMDWVERVREALDDCLTRIGHPSNLEVATSFREACEKLDREPVWHLLVTDIGLGCFAQIEGLEIARRAHQRNLPCIVVSGTTSLDSNGVRDLIKEHNVLDFVSKAYWPSRKDAFTDLVVTTLTAAARGVPQADPVKVFLSYSGLDSTLVTECLIRLTFLENQGRVKVWHRDLVAPGRELAREREQVFDSAELILLLISAPYLKDCYAEFLQAVERHDKGSATLIPIRLRPVDWESLPVAHLVSLPRRRKTVVSSKLGRHDTWADVFEGIREVVGQIAAQRSPRPPAP